jgi:hypothetical protein
MVSETYSPRALELVNLTPLMGRTSGRLHVSIGLIDGPVVMDHPELNAGNIREVSGGASGACSRRSSAACTHGTSVAGDSLREEKRGSSPPAIAPNCALHSERTVSRLRYVMPRFSCCA